MNPYYQLVADRAEHRCEYCKAPESIFNFPFEVEHIIPVSRNGSNNPDNLALACRSCNLHKSSRVTGDTAEQKDVPFFNPRNERWTDHFQIDIDTGKIIGATRTGTVTVEYLEINSQTQLLARSIWIRLGLFP